MSFLYLLAALAPFACVGLWMRNAADSSGRWTRAVLTALLGLALLEMGTALAGRVLGRLDYGLLAAGAGFALLAVYPAVRKRSLPVPPEPRIPWSAWDGLTLVFFLGSTILISLVAWKYPLSDEAGIQGHLSVIESILNGPFPPRFIAFPEIPYRYHYGFNVLAAVICLIGRLPAHAGIDILSVLLWMLGLVSLAAVLRKAGVPRKSLALGLIAVTCTGGLSWFLAATEPGGMGAGFQNPHWQLMYLHGRFLQPHFLLYFFQHPVSLGFVFFLGVILVLPPRWEEIRGGVFLQLVLLLGALSLAHVVFFTTLLAALGLGFFLGMKPKTWGWALLLFILSCALAYGLGGFFQSSPLLEGGNIRFTWPPGYLRNEYWGRGKPIDFKQSLQWYFSAFGVFLVLIPVALALSLKRTETWLRTLGAFCIIGFLVPQFFQYARSWDIVKWFLAFDLSGKILVLAVFAPALEKKVWVLLAWLVVGVSAVAPLRFLGSLAVKQPGTFTRSESRYGGQGQPKAQGSWRDLFAAMRACPECRGMVWSSPGLSPTIALNTGFPVLQLDFNSRAMSVLPRLIAARDQALKDLAAAPQRETLRALDVRWVIFSCAEVEKQPPLKDFLATLSSQADVVDHSATGAAGNCIRAYYLPAAR